MGDAPALQKPGGRGGEGLGFEVLEEFSHAAQAL